MISAQEVRERLQEIAKTINPKPTDTERLEAVEAAVGELAAMLVAAEAKEAKTDA